MSIGNMLRMPEHSHKITKEEKEKAYRLFFGTLTSRIRLDIINCLRKGPKTVSDLQEENDLEQTVVSHNLRRLERCGFVRSEKEGKFRVYSLNKKTIENLMKIIDAHMAEYCVHIISGRRR